MSELHNSIKDAQELCVRLYEALLTRLDPETERILRCYEGLQVAIGLASGNWRWNPRRIWGWEDHVLGDTIQEARELLSTTAEKLLPLDLTHTSIIAVSTPESGLIREASEPSCEG